MTKLHYDDLTTAYTNKILTEIATRSPRRLFTSVSVDHQLLKSSNEDHKHFINKIYQNLIRNSNYRPYLTTTTFKHIPLSATAMKQQYRFFTDSTWQQYSRTYRHLLSNLTNHFNKKPDLQPITFDFFDVHGTRESRYARFTESTIPHIHSIYLVHHSTVEAFESHISNKFLSITKHHSLCDYVNTIHSVPIEQNLHQTVRYCSKFYNNAYAEKYRMMDEYDLFNQFPITDAEKATLAKHRQNHRFQSIYNKILKDSRVDQIDYSLIKKSNDEIRRRFNRS